MPDGIRFRQHVGINQDQNRHDNGGIGYAFRTEKADKDTCGEGGCQGIAEIRAEQRCDNQAVFVPKEAVYGFGPPVVAVFFEVMHNCR